MVTDPSVSIHFTHLFGVDPGVLEQYGAFNISLINDLPLFIDPFLLFNSSKPEYQLLHERMIRYLRYLRDKSIHRRVTPGLVMSLYRFPELKQNWLGFSKWGNSGRGLGPTFARALHRNLRTVFSSFGDEDVTRGSHMEKLTLIDAGVGRDKISDFTANLIKEYLLDYTQGFTRAHLATEATRHFPVRRVRFNYVTENWESGSFLLPRLGNDFVLLTPKDMLTKDEVWINRSDMIGQFDQIVCSLPNQELRAQLNNYLVSIMPRDPSSGERQDAILRSIRRHPDYIEHYIRYKEDNGDAAVSVSEERVRWTQNLFVSQVQELASLLTRHTEFYGVPGDTLLEARRRAEYLKDVVENKGGWRAFYFDGQPLRRESDLHIFFRLTWFGTLYDLSHEVDDGRGPADYKVSRGAADKTIVEFKLASNPKLKQNLAKQVDVYKTASDAQWGLKIIFFFSARELRRVRTILDQLGMSDDQNIVLVDARRDNKPSASRA